jgi:ABC-type lipoprotein export system ATPase subunit
LSYSRWLLADLQVHTPADRAHRYGDVGSPDPDDSFARRLIQAHVDAGVRIVAVTDHNRVDWWPALQAAGDELGVFVFPGIEINVNKCHLLALWDRTDDGYALAKRFLDSLLGPGVGPLLPDRTPRPVDSGSPWDLARRATDHQALVLAPHATARGIGLFGKNVCNTSQQVAQSGLVVGFDVFGNNRADVLTNPRSEFADVPPVWFISGDTRSFDVVGQRAAYFKVGATPTLESLRQAFLMPATRIRFPESLRSDWGHVHNIRFLADPHPTWAHIDRIRIDGGFHNGLEVELGPGMNAIIGGKGTGKSTLVEILRYVLQAPSSIAPAALAKDSTSNREANFPANAEATITYTAPDEQVYTVIRVGNSTGARLFRDTQQLNIDLPRRVQTQVFGQRELAELHKQPRALTEFVFSRSSEDARASVQRMQDALQHARDLAEQLDRLEQQLAATQTQAEELRDLDDRLNRLAEHGASDLVASSEALGRAENAVAELLRWPDTLTTTTDRLRTAAEPPELPEHALIPAGMRTARHAAATGLTDAIRKTEDIVGRLRADLTPQANAWTTAATAERERLNRALADAGLANPGELATLQRRRAELQELVSGADGHDAKRAELLPQREDALDELGAARRAQSRLVEEAARALNARTGPRVRVVIEPLADTSPMLDFVAKTLGKKPTTEQAIRLSALSPADLTKAMASGKRALIDVGLTSTLADRLLELPAGRRREMEEVETPDKVRVEIDLGTEAEPRWTSLNEVSPGQAATAMLALALVGSDEPLVIDQPEDDLDNRFIYDEVVQQIAEVSQRRQIVVATHNANIPVLGDAELILALDATTGHGQPLACGGLDEPDVATVSRSILEGGAEAFDARARRYGRLQDRGS